MADTRIVTNSTDAESGMRDTRAGIVYGLAAYVTWGIAPIYFKAVSSVPPLEVLGHRIIWSIVLLSIISCFTFGWRKIREAFKSRIVILTLIATALLVGANWFMFIWSITNDMLLQASLGYFINPLFSVLLGVVFLKERLSRWGKLSVFLALAGVLYMIIRVGEVPYIALLLAITFGFYGLLRKIVKINAISGLTVETALLGPIALIYLIYLGQEGTGAFGAVSWKLTILLACAGPVTTMPLIWFTKAARRLDLITVGFLQYIAPSLNFVQAVFVFGEAFTVHHGITFGCIWIALAIYSIDMSRRK